MSTDTAHLFNTQAALYAQFRPDYPPELYERVYKFAALDHKGLAMDFGTGNGQCAVVLAKEFDQVVGTDPSAGQLSHAPKVPNITFRQATAEDSGAGDHSVDLITVAQAYHWFNHDAFYKEVKRILKPRGALAVWGYGLNHFGSSAPAAPMEVLLSHYTNTVGEYWDDRRGLIDLKYEGIEPKTTDFEVVERQEVDLVKKMTIAQYVGYLSSWSAYVTYRKVHPSLPDPLPAVQQQLVDGFGAPDADTEIEVVWPVFLLLAKHPKA